MYHYEAAFEFGGSGLIQEALSQFSFDGEVEPGSGTSGTTLKVAGRKVTVLLVASDRNEAKDRATAVVGRFHRWIMLRTGIFIPPPVFGGLDSTDGGGSQVVPLTLVYSVYNTSPEQIRRDAAAAAEACRVSHGALDKAAAYFERGMFATLGGKVVPTAFDAADGILNFHKALELLLGEDPQDAILRVLEPDKERRRILRQRLNPVYEFRRHYDVAHPRLDWTRLEELRERAGACREATRAALLLYLAALERGEQVPTPV